MVQSLSFVDRLLYSTFFFGQVSISDVRGVVGYSLTPHAVFKYVAAFGQLQKGNRMIVGRDSRVSGMWMVQIVHWWNGLPRHKHWDRPRTHSKWLPPPRSSFSFVFVLLYSCDQGPCIYTGTSFLSFCFFRGWDKTKHPCSPGVTFNEADGLRVDMLVGEEGSSSAKGRWVHLCKSNTGPILRVVGGAETAYEATCVS